MRVLVLLGLLFNESLSSCLPEAIRPSQRINLTNPAGESYPLGIDIGPPLNGVIRGTSAVVSILLEEIYGYNVSDFVWADGPNAAAALAGCSNPEVVIRTPELAGCDGEEPRLHVALAVVLSEPVYAPYFKMHAPIRIGPMGYYSTTSIYLSKSIGDAALADGYSLSFYQNWNASWQDPAKYFDPISEIPTEILTPCLQSHFNTPNIVAQYVAISGDYDGLHPNGTAICTDGYWFIAPACRSNVSRCVPVVTGKPVRPLIQTMQKAAAFSMPFAINHNMNMGPAELGVHLENHKMAFFAMHPPKVTTLRIPSIPIEFPPYDELAWSNGDYRTIFRSRDLTSKYVSWNLEKLAPRVMNLLGKLTFPISLIDTIFELAENVSDWRDVGCQWLLSNRDVWQEWIPDETVCLPGFGLYNGNSSHYVNSRPPEAAGLSCIPCASGRFSEVLFDDRGVTYICSPCPVGTSQSSGAALRCEACPAGEYQDLQEGKTCKRCSIGLFQDQLGATACKNCSADSTTIGLGSKSAMECGCKEGSIETARDRDLPTCVVCQQGMTCPKFSTKDALTSGTSELGDDFLPQLLEGFMALEETPLSVFKCRSPEECPGGTPGGCAGGRREIACASCGPEMYWADDECKSCQPWLRAMWIVLLTCGICFLPFCRFSAMKIDSPTMSTLAFTILCIVEIGLNLLQTMGIVGQMPLEWPASMAWSFAFLDLFAFEIHELGFSCMVGGNSLVQYAVQAAFLPCILIWVICVHLSLAAISKRTGRFKRVTLMGPHLVLVLGQIVMMMCFEALSNLSLMPWMCYKHPNGLHSNLQFANILCSSDEHIVMSLSGSVLILLVLAFLSACAWALKKLPQWSSQDRTFPIIASQFLTDQFRVDSWWFGLLILLRGPVLSLLITVFTNEPKSQIMLITMAMITYLVVLLLAWPFKIPLLNALEAACSWSVLILVLGGSLYLPASDSEAMDFSSISTLLSLVTAWLLVGTSLLVAMAHAVGFCFRRQERRFYLLDLGRLPVKDELAQLLVQSALGISKLNQELLEERLQTLSPFDSGLLLKCISMLSVEVLPLETESRWLRSSSRLTSRSASSLRQMTSPLSVPGLKGQSTQSSFEAVDSPSVKEAPVEEAADHAEQAEAMVEKYF